MFSFTRYDAGFLCGAGLMLVYAWLRPSLPFWPFVVASLASGFIVGPWVTKLLPE